MSENEKVDEAAGSGAGRSSDSESEIKMAQTLVDGRRDSNEENCCHPDSLPSKSEDSKKKAGEGSAAATGTVPPPKSSLQLNRIRQEAKEWLMKYKENKKKKTSLSPPTELHENGTGAIAPTAGSSLTSKISIPAPEESLTGLPVLEQELKDPPIIRSHQPLHYSRLPPVLVRETEISEPKFDPRCFKIPRINSGGIENYSNSTVTSSLKMKKTYPPTETETPKKRFRNEADANSGGKLVGHNTPSLASTSTATFNENNVSKSDGGSAPPSNDPQSGNITRRDRGVSRKNPYSRFSPELAEKLQKAFHENKESWQISDFLKLSISTGLSMVKVKRIYRQINSGLVNSSSSSLPTSSRPGSSKHTQRRSANAEINPRGEYQWDENLTDAEALARGTLPRNEWNAGNLNAVTSNVKFITNVSQRIADIAQISTDVQKVQTVPLEEFGHILNYFSYKADMLLKRYEELDQMRQCFHVEACRLQHILTGDLFSEGQHELINEWKEWYLRTKLYSVPNDEDKVVLREEIQTLIFPWILPFMYGRTTQQNGKCLSLEVSLNDLCTLQNFQKSDTKKWFWIVPFLLTQK